MALLRADDTASFNELYRRYSRRLLHFLYRMLGGDEPKAQDFLQDIWITVIEKADTFNQNGKFSSWIFTIASNMCKNEYRRKKKRVTMDQQVIDANITSTEKSIEDRIAQNIFMEFLHKELYNLTFDKRSVFVLRFQEHRTIKEISQILGCAEGTVKSRLHHTVKYLAEKSQAFKEELRGV